jgi:hypothetical protein
MRPNPTVYECKISVSDFRSDVTSGKWRNYLNFAWSVVFACPAGLIAKEQVPEMCGLIVRHENAWRLAKKATVTPKPIDQDALLKLLIDGVEREGPRIRAKAWNEGERIRLFNKRFGEAGARYIGDAASIHERLKQAEYQAQIIIDLANESAEHIRKRATEESPDLWKDILEALDLKVDANKYTVRAKIRELAQAQSGTAEVQALRQVMRFMENFISQHKELIEKGKAE